MSTSVSLFVGVVVLIVMVLAYAILYFRHVYVMGSSFTCLTPIEIASLNRYLNGKMRTIPGGTIFDDLSVFTRNKHELISLIMPTRWSPVAKHERLVVLNFEFGYSYMLSAILTKNHLNKGAEGYFILLGSVTIPIMIFGYVLEYLATIEEKKLAELREEGTDVKDASCVREAKQNDKRLKLKTNVSDQYYIDQTGDVKFAKCGQHLCMVIAVVFWIVGLTISGSMENEVGFLLLWLLSLLQSYAFWFLYQPCIFYYSYKKEEPFVYQEKTFKVEHGEEICKWDEAKSKALAEFIPPLSKKQVESIVTEWAQANCCYATSGVDMLEIGQIERHCSFHYRFDSFGETRSIESVHKPYHPGDYVDRGIEPPLWNVVCPPNRPWHEHEKKVKIPHSDDVKTCYVCNGSGKVRCSSCGGDGRVSGHDNTQKTCTWCHGSGRVKDSTCDGTGQLLWYKLCVAFFGAPSLHFVQEFTAMPDFLIKNAGGKELVKREADFKIAPLDFKESPECGVKSKEFISKHNQELINDPDIRVLKQRHRVTLIPVWEVKFRRHDQEEKDGDDDDAEVGGKKDLFKHIFFIYGEEKSVYFPAYPQKCCCCDCMDGANCVVM